MSTNTTQIDPSFWSDQLFDDDGPNDGSDEMDLTPEARGTFDTLTNPRAQADFQDSSRSVGQTWRGG